MAGEIICKGANLMLGSYKNAEATSQIIDVNGWLHAGDLATMDTEGYVTVRGRNTPVPAIFVLSSNAFICGSFPALLL